MIEARWSRGRAIWSQSVARCVLAMLLTPMVLMACSGAASPSPTTGPTLAPTPSPLPVERTISGTFTLVPGLAQHVSIINDACSGNGGYSDIAAGLQVVVTDNGGKTIGLGHLADDVYATQVANKSSRDLGITDIGDTCVFDFTVTGLPDAPFYGIAVGHRGVVQYRTTDLEGHGWSVMMLLGG